MVFCDVLLDVVWGAQVFPFKQPRRDILIETYASFCLEHFVASYPCATWKLAFGLGVSTWDRWMRQSFGRTKAEADSREVDLTSSRRMPRELGGDEDNVFVSLDDSRGPKIQWFFADFGGRFWDSNDFCRSGEIKGRDISGVQHHL